MITTNDESSNIQNKIYINNTEVERRISYKYLGSIATVIISKNSNAVLKSREQLFS